MYPHTHPSNRYRRKYDSTIARIAGNIASGVIQQYDVSLMLGDRGPEISQSIARVAVMMARHIVSETLTTEPPTDVRVDETGDG